MSLCTLNFFWYLFLVFALRLWFKFFGTIQLPAAFFFLFCFFFPLHLWKTYLSRNKVAISSSESPFNTSNYDEFSPISSLIHTLVLVFHFVFRLGHIILSSCILELMKLLFSLWRIIYLIYLHIMILTSVWNKNCTTTNTNKMKI